MRIVVVGPAGARARLARQLPEAMEIVGEARTIAEARDAGLEAEAYLVASSPGTSDPSVTEALTPRELEVVELLAQGLPNKAIAARLGISDQTVKFHVGAICGKLGAANRTEAAHRALQLGVIPL